MKVLGEHAHRVRAGALGELGAYLPLQRGLDKPFPRVLAGHAHLLRRRAAGTNERALQDRVRRPIVHEHGYAQVFLPLPPVDR